MALFKEEATWSGATNWVPTFSPIFQASFPLKNWPAYQIIFESVAVVKPYRSILAWSIFKKASKEMGKANDPTSSLSEKIQSMLSSEENTLGADTLVSCMYSKGIRWPTPG